MVAGMYSVTAFTAVQTILLTFLDEQHRVAYEYVTQYPFKFKVQFLKLA
jgi:hypothetical protein